MELRIFNIKKLAQYLSIAPRCGRTKLLSAYKLSVGGDVVCWWCLWWAAAMSLALPTAERCPTLLLETVGVQSTTTINSQQYYIILYSQPSLFLSSYFISHVISHLISSLIFLISSLHSLVRQRVPPLGSRSATRTA
jgi:hypothetical protein